MESQKQATNSKPTEEKDQTYLPKELIGAVLSKSKNVPVTSQVVKGYDFNEGINYDKLFDSYATMGFQSTNLSLAIDEINKMLSWRLSDEPFNPELETEEFQDPEVRKNTKCTIFLGYTSNMISCGMREIIRFLVQHKLVDVIVTTAGGVEEDFIKCLAPSYIGDFNVNDIEMRKNALNRIGNLIVPNDNYCKFEDWIMPLYDEMYEEQVKKNKFWTPSKIIRRLGERINNEESVYYWAAKNKIPVFCPALTDGSMGDMLFFHSYKKERFIVDIVRDIRKINRIALKAKKTGAVILGGGIVKHHIMNANLMRNGADFAVFVNTGMDYDGSDAGAKPQEALSWGKLKQTASFVKVFAEATLVFPIIVAKSFAKYHFDKLEKKQLEERELKRDEKVEKKADSKDDNKAAL